MPGGMISMASRPGGVQQLNPAGKQTIVIASPRGVAAGNNPPKIITAVPRAPGGAGTQYIVVGSRPGGVPGMQQSLNVSAGAGRVIRECFQILTIHTRWPPAVLV